MVAEDLPTAAGLLENATRDRKALDRIASLRLDAKTKGLRCKGIRTVNDEIDFVVGEREGFELPEFRPDVVLKVIGKGSLDASALDNLRIGTE